jgi:tRNA threonylcarbamoyladenosine biosynthesis protein TsaE
MALKSPLAAPPAGDVLVLRADSAEATQSFGRLLGSLLRAGDVVGLVGPLGAGKTTLTQGIARGLEVPDDRHVASPTFSLVNEHPGRVPLCHADFYRLRDAKELLELGLDELFERGATVIEWLDLFPSAAPEDHLQIMIALAEPNEQRLITVSANGPRSSELVRSLAS